jgi:hypothetical protein
MCPPFPPLAFVLLPLFAFAFLAFSVFLGISPAPLAFVPQFPEVLHRA